MKNSVCQDRGEDVDHRISDRPHEIISNENGLLESIQFDERDPFEIELFDLRGQRLRKGALIGS